MECGFNVERKRPREMTLRVYTEAKRGQPLLNPRIYNEIASLKVVRKTECLSFAVIPNSKTNEHFKNLLRRFISTSECEFVAEYKHLKDGHYLHGHFVLPLQFIESDSGDEIDFDALRNPLRELGFATLNAKTGD